MSPELAQDYSPPSVDRIWGIRGADYNILKATFYLLKGDYKGLGFTITTQGLGLMI